MYEPQRRIPFGFHGDWGTVYKKIVDLDKVKLSDRDIVFENNFYRDIGASIQFKPTEEITITHEQALKGLKTETLYTTVETTDSYWDDTIKDFVCCVGIGDLVNVLGRLWIVTGSKEKVKYSPNKLSFFYLDLMSIN